MKKQFKNPKTAYSELLKKQYGGQYTEAEEKRARKDSDMQRKFLGGQYTQRERQLLEEDE